MAQTVRRPAHMGGIEFLPTWLLLTGYQMGLEFVASRVPSPVSSQGRGKPTPSTHATSEWARGGILAAGEHCRMDRHWLPSDRGRASLQPTSSAPTPIQNPRPQAGAPCSRGERIKDFPAMARVALQTHRPQACGWPGVARQGPHEKPTQNTSAKVAYISPARSPPLRDDLVC